MPDNISIYLTGLDQLERNANKLLDFVDKNKQALLLSQARIVRDAIKQKAPRGPTGNLKGAAYAKSIPSSGAYPVMAFAGIRPRKAPHAHLVEFGHGGPHPAPPHPFVAPAWNETKAQVRANIEKGLAEFMTKGF